MTMIAVKEGAEETGGTAAVFFNDKTGEVAAAFRGTEKYERRIAERAYAITNHNVNFDYVNFLLNDVGERIWEPS